MADRLHHERLDFTCSQSNAQLCISASYSSDKAYSNLLHKIRVADKCFINRHAKLAAACVWAASRTLAESAVAATVAAVPAQTAAPMDTEMANTERADGYPTVSDAPICEDPTDHGAAISPIDSTLADTGHVFDTDSDKAAASDENSATSSIAVSVSEV